MGPVRGIEGLLAGALLWFAMEYLAVLRVRWRRRQEDRIIRKYERPPSIPERRAP